MINSNFFASLKIKSKFSLLNLLFTLFKVSKLNDYGAPIVPVGLIGTDRLQKPGSNMVYPHRFTIRVGEPMRFEKTGEQMTGKQRRQTTNQIMDEVAQLSGQARKDEYNVSPSAERDAG